MNGQRGRIIITLLSLLFLFVFCVTLYLLRRPVLRAAAHAWIVDDAIEKSDVLLLLSDDNFAADRAAQAALLYRQGIAPLVVASGRRLRSYAGIAELMEHDLVERGVPKQAVIRWPHNADNTREESESLLQLVIERRWKRVIVVTSAVHTRRARYIFRRVFPETLHVRVSGARDLDFDPDRWWESRGALKRMFNEVVGMVVALWELRRPSAAHDSSALLVVGLRVSPTLHMV